MFEKNQKPIAVLGAGAWGSALAILLARNGCPVILWDRDKTLLDDMALKQENSRYLPGIALPDGLAVNHDFAQTMQQVDDILIVVPSIAFRAVLEKIAPFQTDKTRIVWATKGIDPARGELLHTVVPQVLGDDCPSAILSGPTFATEVARGLPTAVTLASHDAAYAAELSSRFHNDYFRVYTSNDVVGVEMGGAVKNVLAIAAGISDGLGFGANSRAALISRGLAEMMRLGVSLGGQRETFMGLAGLGDLVLTCTDNQSRNRRLGLALGQGVALEQALTDINQVVEGVEAAREVMGLAGSQQIEMPIVTQVYKVIYDKVPPLEAVNALLGREKKAEVAL